MPTYFVRPEFLAKNPNARTQVKGQGVSLSGKEQRIQLGGDKNNPAAEKVFRAATQADLAYLYTEKGMTREIGVEDAPAVNKKDQ